jgi:hypothetical protein
LGKFQPKKKPKFVSNITKIYFKTYLITQLIKIKKRREEQKNLRQSQFSKKRGEGVVRRGMIMIKDSKGFFLAVPFIAGKQFCLAFPFLIRKTPYE